MWIVQTDEILLITDYMKVTILILWLSKTK